MGFFILLIIGLLIISVTYFLKIQKKEGLLYFFGIYLIFLLYIGLFEKARVSSFILESSDIGILTIFFGMLFFIFYILLYFFIFPFQDKKLTLKNKGYLLLRDSVVLYGVFMFFFLYNTIVGIYSNYFYWYKNPDNFHSEIYKCEETNTKLLLEYNYPHGTILNPYKNFLEFYNNYREIGEDGKILTNQLQKELVTEQFLITCINKKGENYYNKYLEIHGIQPYYDENINRINLKYKKYFISDSELKDILNNFKDKESVKGEKGEKKQINWSDNLQFTYCDNIEKYSETSELGTRAVFLREGEGGMLDEKMDEHNKENRYKSFPVILAEYCRTEDSSKYIFSAYDKIPYKLGLYDKKIDFIEPANFKYKIFSEITFWARTGNRNYGDISLEKYYEDYRKDKRLQSGFGKKEGNIVNYMNYGVSLISHIETGLVEAQRFLNDWNVHYCTRGLTPAGKLSVCFVDVYYKYDLSNNTVYEDKICSYYIDDNGVINPLQKCFQNTWE